MSAFATFPAEAIRAIQGALGRALAGPSGKDGGYVLQAVITGPDGVPVTYEIVGVESDSQQQTTRLALHQVTN